MPSRKTVVVRHGDKRRDHESYSIEQALKELAKQAKVGELEFPYVLEFDGPAGAKYNISIDNAEAAQEVSTLGFMF